MATTKPRRQLADLSYEESLGLPRTENEKRLDRLTFRYLFPSYNESLTPEEIEEVQAHRARERERLEALLWLPQELS